MNNQSVIRSSVWLDDGERIQLEVIWLNQDGTKGLARLSFTVEEAGGLHDKLHHALMTALRNTPRVVA